MSLIDAKKLTSRKYRSWRVLQAPGAWAQFYRERGMELEGMSGAILFPEQILGVTGSIYNTGGSNNGEGQTVKVLPVNGVGLWVGDAMRRKPITTLQELYDFEFAHQNRNELDWLLVGTERMSYKFKEFFGFTNKRSALKWVYRYLDRTIR